MPCETAEYETAEYELAKYETGKYELAEYEIKLPNTDQPDMPNVKLKSTEYRIKM